MDIHEFEEAIKLLRSKDPLTYEEGYHWLQGENLQRHIEEIVGLMQDEQDPEMRAKFLELVGDADLEQYVPVLVEELSHRSREVRMWAYNQLSLSIHQFARRHAQAYRRSHPDEQFY